jgi:2-isopropylmalate synthase
MFACSRYINGIGERCGNDNLCSVVPALQIKKGYECVSNKNLKKLSEISKYVNEVSNLIPNDSEHYIGKNAFTHKAGVHVSAIKRTLETYEHIDPSLVGNSIRILVSDLAGKSNVVCKSVEMDLGIENAPEKVKRIVEIVKAKENEGFQYEDADASFFLMTKKSLESFKPFLS